MQARSAEVLEAPLAHDAYERQPWDVRSWVSFGIASGFGAGVIAFVAFALSHHPH